MKKLNVFHPVLFTVYPVLALYAHNLGQVRFQDVIRTLIVVSGLTLLMLVILSLLLRDWEKTSLIVLAVMLLCLYLGNIYRSVKPWQINGFAIGRVRFLYPLAFLLLVVWGWWVTKKLADPKPWVRFLSWVGVISLIFLLSTMMIDRVQRLRIDEQFETKTLDLNEGIGISGGDQTPDVFYIILDGYGRADLLDDLYGFDNSEFISFLESRGFYVARDATSNYAQTLLSIASSLNMEYINPLSDTYGADSENKYPLTVMVAQNRVREFLTQKGYQFVDFQTVYREINIVDADFFLDPKDETIPMVTPLWHVNAFESLFLGNTAIQPLFDTDIIALADLAEMAVDPPYQYHRERILYAFEKLPQVAHWDGDYFVYAHIVAPHPPFVFDRFGEAIIGTGTYLLSDGSHYEGARTDYIKGYIDQLIYINALAEVMIDAILANANSLPIIILQADHGPGAFLDWGSAENTNLRERFSILNAYYFPDQDYEMLSPQMTPVNSFRVVLDQFFGADYNLLENENYFSLWDRPYDFIRVTDQLNVEQ
jgi:uncharacterized membrane protein